MPENQTPELLTSAEVAEILKVPQSSLHRMRYERRGPRGFRMGNRLRYTRADVNAYVAQLKAADAES